MNRHRTCVLVHVFTSDDPKPGLYNYTIHYARYIQPVHTYTRFYRVCDKNRRTPGKSEGLVLGCTFLVLCLIFIMNVWAVLCRCKHGMGMATLSHNRCDWLWVCVCCPKSDIYWILAKITNCHFRCKMFMGYFLSIHSTPYASVCWHSLRTMD